MCVEELMGFRGAELVINATNDSLNRRTQHLMQPNIRTVPSLRDHLRIQHLFPFQRLSDSPLPPNVFTQSIGVESVQGDLLVIGAGANVRTRVEEHQEICIEDSATSKSESSIMPNEPRGWMARVGQQPRRQLRWERQRPSKRLIQVVRHVFRSLVRKSGIALHLASVITRRTRSRAGKCRSRTCPTRRVCI